jgi:hypothetical protein
MRRYCAVRTLLSLPEEVRNTAFEKRRRWAPKVSLYPGIAGMLMPSVGEITGRPPPLRALVQGDHGAHAAPVRDPPTRRVSEEPDLRHRPDRRRGRRGRRLLQPEPPRPPRQASAWRLPRCPAPGHYTLAHSISRKERDSVRQSVPHCRIMPLNGLRNEGSVRLLAGPKNTGEAGKREDHHPAYTDTRTPPRRR